MNAFCKSSIALAALLAFSTGAQAGQADTTGGIKVKSDDGAFEGQFGGRVHLDAAVYDDDDTNVGGNDNGAYFRRLRLEAKAKLYNDWGAKFQFDYSNNRLDVKDAFISYTRKSETLISEFQLGQYKQPMGLEELTSSNYITFIERSAPINAIAPNHRIGAGYTAIASSVTAKASLYAGSNTATTNPSTGTGLGGRLTWTPVKDKINLLHLGLSAAGEADMLQCNTFGAAATSSACAKVTAQERNLNPFTSSRWGTRNGTSFRTAALTDGKYDVVRAGLEAAYVYGPLYVQAEYLYGDLQGEKNFDAQFAGYYLSTGYFLTGETRPYKAGEGVFDRIKPISSTGAWEVAARFSSYEGESSTQARTGRVDDITLGLNWYLNPQVRFMINYSYADPNAQAFAAGGNPQAVALRAQVDF